MTIHASRRTGLILAAGLSIFALAACAPVEAPSPASSATPDAAHTSRNSLDWAGTYRGVVPCADCEGIETVVTLRGDGTYVLQSRYLGKPGAPMRSEGRFEWSADGGSVSLSGQEPGRFRVGEGRLTQLALDGSVITGALADNYVLAKLADGITEKYWKLVELRGQPVPASSREPHLILKAEGSRAGGSTGCNSFGGTYTLDETTSRISFGQLVMTQMFCADAMETEKAFSEVLGQVDNYSLNGDHLTLNRARMAPLARFEAVFLR